MSIDFDSIIVALNLDWLLLQASIQIVPSPVFDVQEDNDTRDVVDHVLFALPLLERSTHEIFGSTFCVALQEERVHDVCNLLIFEELPHAIAG